VAAGVKLFEFEPTMIHSKLMIADGLFVSIGSANFDPRSLRINDEANLIVLDAEFAREQSRIFRGDLLRARKVGKGGQDVSKVHEVPVQTAQQPVESQL
jgi:cardiolipin synthase